jgi:hypothetical protein
MKAKTQILLSANLATAAIAARPATAFTQASALPPQSDQGRSADHPETAAADAVSSPPIGTTLRRTTASNVDGRIASIKTALKISQTQAQLWNGFADASHAATSVNPASYQTMQSVGAGTLLARLDVQETALVSHVASLEPLTEALDPLYASFSDEQKKVMDELKVGPTGVM